MQVLIIEDEKEAFENLSSMLLKYDPTLTIVGWLTSVQNAIEWFKTEKLPDLVFLDIYLSDGLSFEIFKQIEVKTPIIFTTAYHEYAIQAFETNSVDYLLKPFHFDRLKQSLDKFNEFHVKIQPNLLQRLTSLIGNEDYSLGSYKNRFLVKSGTKLFSVNTCDIAYFYRDDMVFLVTFDKSRFIIEYALDELEKLLAPKEFFRLNRQVIVNIKAIEATHAYSKGKFKVKLNPALPSDTIISQQKASQFKKWLDDDTHIKI